MRVEEAFQFHLVKLKKVSAIFLVFAVDFHTRHGHRSGDVTISHFSPAWWRLLGLVL